MTAGVVSALGRSLGDARRAGEPARRERHPDRRRAQPGQLRRRAGRFARPGRRHQHGGRRDRSRPGRPDRRRHAPDPRALIVDGRVRRAFLGIVGGTRTARPRPSRHGSAGRAASRSSSCSSPGPPRAPACASATSCSSSTGTPIEGVGDLQRRLVGDVIGRRSTSASSANGEARSVSVSPVELDRASRPARAGRDPASIRRVERLVAWYRVGSSVGAVAALIVANLVPLVGVLWFGWNVWTILIIYWLENGVVGVFNVLKMRRAEGPEPSPGGRRRPTTASVPSTDAPPRRRRPSLDPVLHRPLRASSGWSTASSC